MPRQLCDNDIYKTWKTGLEWSDVIAIIGTGMNIKAYILFVSDNQTLLD